MSWESTATYYKLLNEGIREQLGGLHSARVILYSVEFQEIEHLQNQGNWQQCADILIDAAKHLENAGADFLVIATNTMHKLAGEIQNAINIPLLHIADATALIIKQQHYDCVGLLGTAFTMEQDFYRGQLRDLHQIEVLVPHESQRQTIHQVIYDELCLGKVCQPSKDAYLKIIDQLAERGAQAVILGCTEIPLLIKQSDTAVPLLDTTRIHARAAVTMALD